MLLHPTNIRFQRKHPSYIFCSATAKTSDYLVFNNHLTSSSTFNKMKAVAFVTFALKFEQTVRQVCLLSFAELLLPIHTHLILKEDYNFTNFEPQRHF